MVHERRGRGDRHERLGLRRDGQGVRPLARARPGTTPTKAGRIADLTRDLSELAARGLDACAAGRTAPRAPSGGSRSLPGRRSASRSIRRARCSTGSSCAAASRRSCARSASTSASRPTKRTCAAARPAPTRCCSPSSPTRCATASSPTSPTLAPRDHRLGQHRLHPAPAERHGDAGPALDRGARRRARALSRRRRDGAALRGARCRSGARRPCPLHLALRGRGRGRSSRRCRPTAAAS